MPAVILLAWVCLIVATVWLFAKRQWPLALMSLAGTLVLVASIQYLM